MGLSGIDDGGLGHVVGIESILGAGNEVTHFNVSEVFVQRDGHQVVFMWSGPKCSAEKPPLVTTLYSWLPARSSAATIPRRTAQRTIGTTRPGELGVQAPSTLRRSSKCCTGDTRSSDQTLTVEGEFNRTHFVTGQVGRTSESHPREDRSFQVTDLRWFRDWCRVLPASTCPR